MLLRIYFIIPRPLFSSLPSPADSTKPAMTGSQLHDLVQETHSLAFFPRAALLNHSCAPCCSMFYEKDATGRPLARVVCSAAKRMRLSVFVLLRSGCVCLCLFKASQVALRSISKNEQLTISYGPCQCDAKNGFISRLFYIQHSVSNQV